MCFVNKRTYTVCHNDDITIVHDKLQQVMETLFGSSDTVEVLSLPSRSVICIDV